MPTYEENDERRNELIARESARPGLRGKINAFCISCIFDHGSGGGSWKQQVTDCTATTCPLYTVRPLSEKEDKGAEV